MCMLARVCNFEHSTKQTLKHTCVYVYVRVYEFFLAEIPSRNFSHSSHNYLLFVFYL